MNRRVFLTGALATAACSRGPRLNIYNWSDYIGPETIANFERETGIRVRYGTYESMPELLAKVMTGNSGWDVIFPSAEYIQPMQKMGLLADLSHAQLPHLDALEPVFRTPPWDPELRSSIPYMHGTTGIAHRQDIAKPPHAWADLWDARFSGKITMLDESSEVLGICLQMLGFSLNSGDPGQLRKAQQEALRQKKLLRAYLNAEVRDQLVAGDVLAGQVWAVTAAQAIAAAPGKVAYVLPAEGFPRYADCIGILKESARADFGHRFLDFLLRGDVAADIVRTTHTATVNAAARKLLPPDDAVLYPPEQVLARGEWFTPQSSASQRLRDRLWTEVKSS